MREVPQINPETGVSSDYFNEYNPKVYALGLTEPIVTAAKLPLGLTQRIAELFKQYPVKKYGERFPPTHFVNVVNDQNRARISRLDEIADEANTQFIDLTQFTLEDFKRMIREVADLVYGPGNHNYYPEVQ